MRPIPAILRSLALLALLAGCRGDGPDAARDGAIGTAAADRDTARDGDTPAAAGDAGIAALMADVPPELRGVVAAHWFGRQWPKNWLAGFRRADVDADFAMLKADGFDAVVLLVAWGDFQPVAEPCCTYDERAFERLRFVLERADAAGLKVMLRVGYGWSFHPDAGDVGERQQQLLNRADVRAAYHAFVRRLGAEVADRDEVVLAFMSWEDQWLRRIDDSARDEFAEYAATLPPGSPRDDTLPDAATDARRFHGYWDWLVREKLYAPAVGVLPNLSYEARIDREPVWTTDAAGARTVAEWLPHDGMYELPGAPLLTVYWAPFWGAINDGEQLPATRSLELLTALLREARGRSGKALFVDQFNVVDNTPGHERNAVLKADEVPAFLHRAACVLRIEGVAAVGFWTARDYAESPLYNPAFGYGLDGWTVMRGAAPAPASVLETLPGGDFQVRLAAGDVLSQQVPNRHGRLPRRGDTLTDRVCIEADVRSPAVVEANAGWHRARLAFDAAGVQRRCAAIEPVPGPDALDVAVALHSGDLAVRAVQLFDHVQYGGLRGLDGDPGPLLEPWRRFATDFRAEPMPVRCAAAPASPSPAP